MLYNKMNDHFYWGRGKALIKRILWEGREMEDFYLLDLETVGSGVAFYWKLSRHGYTCDLKEAGLFSREFAEKLVNQDFDKRTIMIPKEIVFKILGKEMESHEGIRT